jgi:predicted AAA+ superfamily ATPase
LFSGKAIVVIGARQTGKTTSINNIISNLQDVLVLNGDDDGRKKQEKILRPIQHFGLFLHLYGNSNIKSN